MEDARFFRLARILTQNNKPALFFPLNKIEHAPRRSPSNESFIIIIDESSIEGFMAHYDHTEQEFVIYGHTYEISPDTKKMHIKSVGFKSETVAIAKYALIAIKP